MKLHYKGKFDGNADSIPCGEHKPGAVKFREPEDAAALSKVANGIGLALMAFTLGLLFGRGGLDAFSSIGALGAILMSFPHEFLHAIGFREDVYLYTNWRNGILFVVGPEDMSKTRFVVMSLLPNVVFGLIPLVAFLINPELHALGTM